MNMTNNNQKLFSLFSIPLSGLFILLASTVINAQVDNMAKNGKLMDEEKQRFEKELASGVDSAVAFWNHANVLASFTFNAQKTAWKFYEKALEKDSSKVIYFVDYAKYLHKMQYTSSTAKLLARALPLFPDNEELLAIDKEVKKKTEEENKIKEWSDIGRAPEKGNEKTTSHSKLSDFEKLIEERHDKQSPFFYDELIRKFDQNLTLS